MTIIELADYRTQKRLAEHGSGTKRTGTATRSASVLSRRFSAEDWAPPSSYPQTNLHGFS